MESSITSSRSSELFEDSNIGLAPSRRGLQAEKSASTRGRILEAAIECLIELGYSGTTTVEVAERAGVSRGAMLHHYPSKAELLYAAMEYLHVKRLDDLRKEVSGFSDADDVVEVAVNLFWEMAKHPYYFAMQELIVAARTDEELRRTLLPLAHRFEDEIFRVTKELFSGYAKPGTPFEEMRDVTRFMFDGLSMGRVLHEDDAYAGRALHFIKKLLRDLLVNPDKPDLSPDPASSAANANDLKDGRPADPVGLNREP